MSGNAPTEMPPEDDDQTVPGPAGRARPSGAGPLTSHNALPPGTRLGEFEILGLVGEGGFGIVYLAHDHNLQRRVALKEYLPSSLAGRAGGLIVSVVSERHAETFDAGLRSFVNEARLLAKFDHPSLVKVYRFWEGNGTAYMVMPYYEGVTVGEALKRMGKPPDEGWLKRLLSDLLDALAVLHAAQCLHRDIAPDNILILESGRPVLLDFGAARRVIGDRSQALTVILKPGYAPVEQYADSETMKQGPWTDVYALASVAYFAIMGEPPTASVARIISDPLVPLAQAAAGRYSGSFLEALDHAMAVKPEDRPRDTAAMRNLLGFERRAFPREPGPSAPPAPPPSRPVAPPERRSRAKQVKLATAGLALGAAGLAVWFLIREPEPPTAPPRTQGEAAPKVVEQPAAAPPPAPAPSAPAAPFDPIRALDQVFEARNRDHAVSVSLEKALLRIGQDRLRFSVRSAKPGYLYVLMVGTDRSHIFLLFPNALDRSNRIEPGKDLELPKPQWQITAAGPPGTNHFVAFVSDRPRDFAAAGLKDLQPFSEFPFDVAERLSLKHAGPQPLLAGTPVCPGTSACPDGYGAAVFSIEEIPAR
jgi:serine/threonine protein kinase